MKHTEKELIEIYTGLKGDDSHFEYFLKFYEVAFQEFILSNDWEDEDESTEEHTLKFCLEFYLPFFIKSLKEGHGAIWSDKIANLVESVKDSTITTYLVENPFLYAYDEINKENPELAWKEINVHCNSLSNDEIFKRYYLFLIKNHYKRDMENKIFNYAQKYKEQISLGKTEVYAHEYAHLRTEVNDEIYCEEYAFAYDKAISENKSIEYAIEYAFRYASVMEDTREIYFDDDGVMIDFAIAKVNAYMEVWVSEQTQFKGFNRFAEIYEDVYFKTYFSDEERASLNIEDTNAMILKEVLERFNK